ncbi:restriction endonuclease subunit S [Phascolarctobacterium succinatutens]|uniref:restriction endonuclease subunit S n=1 Tax=Phascolarctobacterium succinatutens TaxID=626940 RepID=UPI003D06A418
MAKLGDIATYINGYAFKPSDWSTEGLPIIRIQDLTGSSYKTNKYNGDYDKKYEVNNGDILISWSASLGVFVWKNDKAVLNQHIFKVIFNKKVVDKDFFVYQVENILRKAQNSVHGATMKHLTKPVFDSLDFYLPLIEEQKRIAKQLKLINLLIDHRNDQIKKLDLLVKSRFVEMFGSMYEPKYKLRTLNDVCEYIKDGTHQTPTYTDDKIHGYKFLSSKDVTSGKIDWSKIKYIPKELHDELYAKIAPRRGDILLAKNGTTGVAALVECNEVFDIYVSLAILRLKEHNNPKYILEAINSQGTKEQFNKSLKGIGVPNLHLGEIKKAKIIIPPIELQNQFADFVAQVDKSKLAIQQSLYELETLKKSLMQQYFG